MARSTFKVLFYVNGSKEKNGIVPIMGRVTINGTVAQFSCKRTIPKELWDAKGNKAKGKSMEARETNLALDNIKAQIIKHYQHISDREAYVTAEMVRNAYQGLGGEYETLLGAFDKENEVFKKRVGKDRVRATYMARVRARNHYRDLKRKTGELEANMRQLQTEQQQAEQQLDEVRQEVKSEKLEVAKTEAKAAFVAKVGSLFCGGKLKEFEHRNEDLQKRIQELEEEAIQREEQHSKQIQEMKNAYERQYRKLSEFTDFVKRYFPYVEKLMPTIKFLRDTLNFGDGLIKKLCIFKDVTIKGELYSTEFRQHFKTDGSVCSLIETSDGKFDLKIDGVSHVSWFRRKKYEFMKALGLPKQEQQSKKL